MCVAVAVRPSLLFFLLVKDASETVRHGEVFSFFPLRFLFHYNDTEDGRSPQECGEG